MRSKISLLFSLLANLLPSAKPLDAFFWNPQKKSLNGNGVFKFLTAKTITKYVSLWLPTSILTSFDLLQSCNHVLFLLGCHLRDDDTAYRTSNNLGFELHLHHIEAFCDSELLPCFVITYWIGVTLTKVSRSITVVNQDCCLVFQLVLHVWGAFLLYNSYKIFDCLSKFWMIIP